MDTMTVSFGGLFSFGVDAIRKGGSLYSASVFLSYLRILPSFKLYSGGDPYGKTPQNVPTLLLTGRFLFCWEPNSK